MTIKCVLFDADGVLIHAEMFSVQYHKKYGVPYDDMLPFFKGELQQCLVGKADLAESLQPWLPKWNWEGSVDDFLHLWFSSEDHPDHSMISAVQELREKGILCYLATNQEKYRTQYMKDKMGFEGIFNHVFSSADIGAKKPEQEFYRFVLEELKNEHGILPHEILYFDDSQENVDGALELDMDARLFTDYESFKKDIDRLIE